MDTFGNSAFRTLCFILKLLNSFQSIFLPNRDVGKTLFLFLSIKHTYRNEAKIELFLLTESIWCQESYRHSCLKLGNNHARCYDDIYATKIRTVYLSDRSAYLHQSSLAFKFSGVYVFGCGVRFENVYCFIIDLYSDASGLWYV